MTRCLIEMAATEQRPCVRRKPVTALTVSFDNVLNVQFPRARECVRIRNLPPDASVARWPMTDAHGVKVNICPTGARYFRVSSMYNPNALLQPT